MCFSIEHDTNSTVVKRIQYRKWTYNLTLTLLWLNEFNIENGHTT